MKKLNKLALGLATLVMGLGGNAMAASETGTVQVNASILPTCEVALTATINFQYNPQDGASESHSFPIICTKGTSYEIDLNGGIYGSQTNRVMKNGENSLRYIVSTAGDIFDGSWGKWGDVGSGTPATWGIQIEIPRGQYVQSGTYTDELVVTFTY